MMTRDSNILQHSELVSEENSGFKRLQSMLNTRLLRMALEVFK
jgi:hypothetical protein